MTSYNDFKRRAYSDRDNSYGYGSSSGMGGGGGYEGDGRRDSYRERPEGWQPREDNPPYSRLFIIGGKTLTEQDFRETFEVYGTIEKVDLKQSKGITYVKFAQTSSAAEALEEMNGKSIGSDPRPLKIVIASSKTSGNSREDVNPLRVFVVIPRNYTEDKFKSMFEEYGPVEYVSIVKDRNTGESRGFGYVKYFRFSHAAKALEGCDQSFKPKFADPRPPKDGGGPDKSYGLNTASGKPEFSTNMFNPSNTNKLTLMANPILSQEKLWKLFDIIPGLEFCELNQQADMSGERAYGSVIYNTPKAASYAIEKLHGFDYPLGSRIMLKFDDGPMPSNYHGRGTGAYGTGGTAARHGMPADIKNLVSTIQHATQMLQASGYAPPSGGSWSSPQEAPLDPNMCSADLPPVQPLATIGTAVAMRLFFVCKDARDNPPPHIITDVFSRFGNLIEAYIMKGKNCGYAKYADPSSAQKAIHALNEHTLMGSFLKVMVAEESNSGPSKRPRRDFD